MPDAYYLSYPAEHRESAVVDSLDDLDGVTYRRW